MLQEYKRKTNIGVGLGAITQIVGQALLHSQQEVNLFAGTIYIVGLVLFVWGCAQYARGKGYTPIFWFLGLLSILGLILLVLLPDKHKASEFFTGKPVQSRKKTLLFLVTLALIAAAATLWTLSGGDPKGTRVLITDVVDGDTVHVGRGWRRTTVRLIGVDAPETIHPEKPVEAYGLEASEFAERTLTGKWVRLEFESGNQNDVYGRLLAYIFLEDGTLFNRELVRYGYAKAYTRFPFRYKEEFRLVETEARNAGQGLWARHNKEGSTIHLSRGKIIGNRRSMIFHVHGQDGYGRVSEENRIYFEMEEEAAKAGYRRSKK